MRPSYTALSLQKRTVPTAIGRCYPGPLSNHAYFDVFNARVALRF